MHFVEQRNAGRKPDKNVSPRGLKFLPRNLDLKLSFKNSISGFSMAPADPTESGSSILWFCVLERQIPAQKDKPVLWFFVFFTFWTFSKAAFLVRKKN